jgi:hypothetical protein
MTIRRTCIACWIPKAYRYTQSGCVIVAAFPQQHWLHERASVLRYTYITLYVHYVTCTYITLHIHYVIRTVHYVTRTLRLLFCSAIGYKCRLLSRPPTTTVLVPNKLGPYSSKNNSLIILPISNRPYVRFKSCIFLQFGVSATSLKHVAGGTDTPSASHKH